MYAYERSYKVGRLVASILEITGWVIVALGVLAALGGFASGSSFGISSRSLGGGGSLFLLRLIATLPGVMIAATGLFFIMKCQETKASLDSAEMSREILGIARKISGLDTVSNESKQLYVSIAANQPQKPGHTIKIYKGYEIIRETNGCSVEGQQFASVIDAEKYISKLNIPSSQV